MSDSADTRVVAARYSLSAAQTVTDNTPTTVIWNTTANGGYDTHSAMNTANGRYTFASAGKYRFSAAVGLASSISIVTQNRISISYRINGGTERQLNFLPFSGSVTETPSIGGSDSVDVLAGDYIEIRATLDFGGASYNIVSSAGGLTYFAIEKIQGPSAIAASESINAVYTTAAGQSIPNATDTIIDFGTAEINSHGNVTTGAAWKFTSNINAVYEVSAFVQLNSGGGWNISEESTVAVFKNGSVLATLGLFPEKVVNSVAVSIPCSTRQVRLLAGDYIDIRVNQNSGASLSLVAATTRNWVSIKKVGN